MKKIVSAFRRTFSPKSTAFQPRPRQFISISVLNCELFSDWISPNSNCVEIFSAPGPSPFPRERKMRKLLLTRWKLEEKLKFLAPPPHCLYQRRRIRIGYRGNLGGQAIIQLSSRLGTRWNVYIDGEWGMGRWGNIIVIAINTIIIEEIRIG